LGVDLKLPVIKVKSQFAVVNQMQLEKPGKTIFLKVEIESWNFCVLIMKTITVITEILSC
jgi:hypothetical protein